MDLDILSSDGHFVSSSHLRGILLNGDAELSLFSLFFCDFSFVVFAKMGYGLFDLSSDLDLEQAPLPGVGGQALGPSLLDRSVFNMQESVPLSQSFVGGSGNLALSQMKLGSLSKYGQTEIQTNLL